MNSNYNDNNVNVSFDSVSKAAFGIEDPNAERVPIDVAAFDRQREIRKERRLDAVKRRTAIKTDTSRRCCIFLKYDIGIPPKKSSGFLFTSCYCYQKYSL